MEFREGTTLTESERTEVRKLAREVLKSRVVRLCEVGTTKKGRVVGVLVGEATSAEVEWEALRARLSLSPAEAAAASLA